MGAGGTNKGDADDGKCLIICQRFSADRLCGKNKTKKLRNVMMVMRMMVPAGMEGYSTRYECKGVRVARWNRGNRENVLVGGGVY